MRLHIIQMICGAGIVLFGAWLIGRWAVGVALALIGIMVIADALLRNVPDKEPQIADSPLEPQTLDQIFEKAKRAA